jgi:hypothetical protein
LPVNFLLTIIVYGLVIGQLGREPVRTMRGPSFFDRDVSGERLIATRLAFVIVVLCVLITLVAFVHWL